MKKHTPKKLLLRQQTLRQLSDLDRVTGGRPPPVKCTTEDSGCISNTCSCGCDV